MQTPKLHVGIAPYTSDAWPKGNASYCWLEDGKAVATLAVENGEWKTVRMVDRLLPLRPEFVRQCMEHFRSAELIRFS